VGTGVGVGVGVGVGLDPWEQANADTNRVTRSNDKTTFVILIVYLLCFGFADYELDFCYTSHPL
jgi:hypothetical protein